MTERSQITEAGVSLAVLSDHATQLSDAALHATVDDSLGVWRPPREGGSHWRAPAVPGKHQGCQSGQPERDQREDDAENEEWGRVYGGGDLMAVGEGCRLPCSRGRSPATPEWMGRDDIDLPS
jgi:hypothetical protein